MLAQHWHQRAQLCAEDHQAIKEVKDLLRSCHGRPTSLPCVDASSSLSTSSEQQASPAALDSLEELYVWFDELSCAVQSQEEQRWVNELQSLDALKRGCRAMMKDVDQALGRVQHLREQHQGVGSKTTALHDACEAIVNEQQKLQAFCDALHGHLKHFENLDSLSAKISTYAVHAVADADFSAIMDRLDDSIDYIQEHPHYRSSQVLLAKCTQLRAKGMSLMKLHFSESLKTCAQAAQAELVPSAADASSSAVAAAASSSSSSSTSLSADGEQGANQISAELAHYETAFFIRFRTLAQRLRPLVNRIEQRHHVGCYRDLLDDLHDIYAYWRQSILGPYIQAIVGPLVASSSSLAVSLRSCFHSVIELALQETQLFFRFFHPSTDAVLIFKKGLLGSAATVLVDSVRPIYIKSHSIEQLVSVATLIKTELLEDRLSKPRYANAAPFVVPIANTMLADVQERLIFLAQTFIRDEIAAFRPGAEHLDYPARLAVTAPTAVAATATTMAQRRSNADAQLETLMASWYPTLRSTLLLLSKLYLTVNAPIFEAIAQEALEECTCSIARASQLIAARGGQPDAALHGRLFYLQHLCILNEQIKSFDIDFQMTERSLDLSFIKDSWQALASGGLRTLWSSITQPRVHDSQKNTKRDLEQALAASLTQLCDEHVNPVCRDVAALVAAVAAGQDVAAELHRLPATLLAFETAVVEKIAPLRVALLKYLGVASIDSANQIIEQLRSALVDPFAALYPLVAAQYPDVAAQLPPLDVLSAKISAAFAHNPDAKLPSTLDL